MAERIQYEVGAGVATIRLDDPSNRNALGGVLLDELLAAFARARDDAAVRVVVLASTHPTVFSAGGDLGGFRDERATIDKYRDVGRFPQLFRDIATLGKPVLCAAHGHTLAGAFGLALACDLVIAARSATFGCPEINVGAFPFMISALIYRNVGRVKANELMLLGEQISAEEAAHVGIVNLVVADEDFEDVVADWARRLAAKSPLLVQLGKDAIAATRDMHLDEALDHLQGQLALAFTTHDLQEGVAAFFEKREPRWVGA